MASFRGLFCTRFIVRKIIRQSRGDIGLDATIFCPYNQEMKTKRGRPPKAPSELAEERVELRLHPADKAAWLKLAERAGMTLSAWIRDRLDKAAKREANRN